VTDDFDPTKLADVEEAPEVEPEPEPDSHDDSDQSDLLPDEPDA
jgi:hypothetical protein